MKAFQNNDVNVILASGGFSIDASTKICIHAFSESFHVDLGKPKS